MSTKGDHGRKAEQLARQLLEAQQLKFIDSNYHCRFGEIDLIMLDKNNTLVFVEVRYRKNQQFGGAIESITHSKQNKLRLTASHYLQKKNSNKNARFDVVLLSSLSDNTQINWIKSAFE